MTACGAPHVGRGVPVSGTVQVLSDPRGRAPVESPALCGTECLAGELGGVGRGVAVVQLMASAQGRPFGRAGRGAGALAGGLATAGAVRGDGSRTRSIAAVGVPRRALRGSVLAGPNGPAITPGIHAPRTRSATEASASLDQRDLRLPTPFAGLAAVSVTRMSVMSPFAPRKFRSFVERKATLDSVPIQTSSPVLVTDCD